MQSKMFRKLNKIQKAIIACVICLSLIFINIIPYFAEDVVTSDLCFDVEEEKEEIAKENSDEVIEENSDEINEEIIEEMAEEEIDEIAEEEIDEIVEEKIDDAIEEKNEEVVNDEIDENILEKEIAEEELKDKVSDDSVMLEEATIPENDSIEEIDEEDDETKIIDEVDVEEDEDEIIEDTIIKSNDIVEPSIENEEKVDSTVATPEPEEVETEVVTASELEELEVATVSELDEIEVATISEVDEVIEEIATTSIVSVKIFWIDSVNLKDSGVSGSYNYEWDTFTVKEGEEFTAPDNVTKDIKHSNCNQLYKFIGFTTEDQKTKYWLHADYAAGEKMFDKTFPVENDMIVWAVYDAKDTYVSSIKLVDGEFIFKTTTIPNIAIKNIIVSDKAFENLNDGYKVLKYAGRYIAYTKDSAEGKPMLEEDVKEKIK